MLQSIRDNVQGVVAKIIMGILVVPFAIFGIESLIGNNGPAEVAKVNGEKIREPELAQAMDIRKRQLMARMGDNIQPELLDDAALRKPVLEELITQHMLRQSAESLGLQFSAQDVDRMILAVPDFQVDGKFSPQRYEMVLRNNGYTPAYFKQWTHRELLVDQLHVAIAGSDFVTPAELKAQAGLQQQQRSFRYATLPIAGLADKIDVTDADIKTYYDAHAKDFMSDERVKLEYIELRAQDYFPPLDEAAVKAQFDREMANYKPRVERHAAHIEIRIGAQRNEAQALELARSIEQKLKAGEDFAKLAAQYSDDIGSKNNGGDVGVSTGDAFPAPFEAALAQLAPGQVSEPVKSETGFHVVKLLDQQTAERPTFEQRKAEIAQNMQQSAAQPELTKNVEKLRDLVFNADGLKGPAEEVKAKVQVSDWLDRKSTDPVLGNPKVIAAAFGKEVLKDGNNSDVIELAPDHYIVLRLKEHVDAEPKPLDQVRPAIVATLKQERANAQLTAAAQQLIEQVRKGGDFAQLAGQQGLALKSVEKTTRGSGAAAPELLRAAFALPKTAKEKSIDSLQLANGDIAVLQLQDVAEGVPDSLTPTQRDILQAQLRQNASVAGFAAFMEGIRAKAEIARR